MDRTKTFWTRTYQRHIGRMIGICCRYVSDRTVAEDLAHDAFLRAIESAETYRGVGRFENWLTRITVNTALHYLRDNHVDAHTNRMVDTEELSMENDVEEVDEEMSDDKMMEAIRKADFSQREILEAIAQLPKHHRTVFNLYVFEHYSHKQIAELKGISVNTSKSHLLRARKELQQILFNKSKQKNRPLMTWILPLPVASNALDRYCRRQMRGFAVAPQQPLTTSSLPETADMPIRLRLHAMRIPAMVGLGTTAVSALLLPTLLKQPVPQMQQLPDNSPVITKADSAATQGTVSVDTKEATTSATPPSCQASNNIEEIRHPQPTETMDQTSDSVRPSVVVKKVRRKNMRTIVIQDSEKHE